MQSLIGHIKRIINWIANIGISDSLSFYERKKTQLINLAVGLGIPLNIYFAIKNFAEQRAELGIINVCLMTGAFAILLINSYQRYLLGRSVLSFLASILFSVSAILFRNGSEYYLLLNVVIIITFFSDRRFLISFTIGNLLLFIGIKIFLNSTFVFDQVPFSRVMFNMTWAVGMMVLALLFFKNEQLSYQKQVEEKNHELENMNQTKEKLFSIIAHDLRSPIGQLKSSLEMVNKRYITPEQFIEVTDKLSIQVDQIYGTLDNLLRWSVSQFKGIKVVPEKVSLTHLIEHQAVQFLQPSLEQKNIRLHTEGLQQQQVWADPDHLTLIFRNLITNAIKYSYPDGTITIRAYPDNDQVVVEIRDNGIGMPAGVRDSLFSPMVMVSNTGTSNEKGTGLGLKICKEFTEKNQGRIWVESAPGKGSSFYVSFPKAQ
ncbi:MAG: HAMP domain-containing sensor histidine kinase [Bacteroidota bacterium]|nr:HAMP domain-containing sensor histidine kinase [Bacteroidota bacterium]